MKYLKNLLVAFCFVLSIGLINNIKSEHGTNVYLTDSQIRTLGYYMDTWSLLSNQCTIQSNIINEQDKIIFSQKTQLQNAKSKYKWYYLAGAITVTFIKLLFK